MIGPVYATWNSAMASAQLAYFNFRPYSSPAQVILRLFKPFLTGHSKMGFACPFTGGAVEKFATDEGPDVMLAMVWEETMASAETIGINDTPLQRTLIVNMVGPQIMSMGVTWCLQIHPKERGEADPSQCTHD